MLPNCGARARGARFRTIFLFTGFGFVFLVFTGFLVVRGLLALEVVRLPAGETLVVHGAVFPTGVSNSFFPVRSFENIPGLPFRFGAAFFFGRTRVVLGITGELLYGFIVKKEHPDCISWVFLIVLILETIIYRVTHSLRKCKSYIVQVEGALSRDCGIATPVISKSW